MELDENSKNAVQKLGDAINTAVEQSFTVKNAIETLRELGYEPILTLKLEIGLQEIGAGFDEPCADLALDLTDEDLKTLRRMKIKF